MNIKLPVLVGMLALSISPIKILAQDIYFIPPNQADLCRHKALSSPEARIISHQMDEAIRTSSWLKRMNIEEKLVQMDTRCRLIAPHIASYGTLTVARLLVQDTATYENAAHSAYCANREGLVDLYLAKANLLLDAMKHEPAEGLDDVYKEVPGSEIRLYNRVKHRVPDRSCIFPKYF
jgi:phosphopantothenoylcysteine synthetase/decarboxylase